VHCRDVDENVFPAEAGIQENVDLKALFRPRKSTPKTVNRSLFHAYRWRISMLRWSDPAALPFSSRCD